MGGDFNCPSSHWDATVLHEHPMATRLMECATFLNMERVALPLGWVTHLPYNAALRGLILDLVFLPIYQGYMVNLTIGDKGKPNHFPLLLDVPLKVFWPEGKMSIKADSKEEADFLGEVIISHSQIPIPDVMSADQTLAVAQAISKVFDLAWTHHARAKQACTCSKSWWDVDCNRARPLRLHLTSRLTGWPLRRLCAKQSTNILMSILTRLLTLTYDPGTLWTGLVSTKPPLLRQSHTRVCLAHLQINCGTLSTPPSTQHWTGLLTCQHWVTNGHPLLSGLGYHILLWSCQMPSWVLQTDLPPGQITSCGIILSVSSTTGMRAAYFYGWQMPVFSLATCLLNSRPLLQWLYQNLGNCCMILPSRFAQLFF
jgi:hypothetical protein